MCKPGKAKLGVLRVVVGHMYYYAFLVSLEWIYYYLNAL